MKLSARKPSPAMIVACISLFVGLSGVGTAAVVLAKNSVLSKHIRNGQVKRADLGANAVSSAKVGDGSLLAQDFATGQLPAGSPNPNAVNSDTVDGYHANQLVRSATTTDTAGNDIAAVTSTTGITLMSADITAPVNGFLVVSGEQMTLATGNAVMHCGLDVDQTAGTAWQADFGVSTYSGTQAGSAASWDSCHKSYRFTVSQGAHTVRYKARNVGTVSGATLFAYGGSMHVSFIPFDAIGA